MVVFNNGKSGSSRVIGANRQGAEAPLSILARGVKLVGTLETSGVVRVEGEVEGDLRAKGGQILVAPGGVVEGDVEAALAVIAGEVRGQIVAAELVELKSGGLVYGNITTPRITVEEGGAVNGTLKMTNVRAGTGGRAASTGSQTPAAETALKRVG